jgi:hypothetical protein
LSSIIFVPEAQATNSLSGWSYRKSHVINSASGAGTNYQVQIITYAGSGTDTSNTVYLNNHARSDFGDVRFTASDGSTLLNYWQEANYTISGLTKYPSSPFMTGNEWFASVLKNGTTYHMYYQYGDSPTLIGHATSSDGKNWTRDTAHNPVLNVGASGKFDDTNVRVPNVWIEGSTWYMIYTGYHSGNFSIGLAESTDAVTWTRQNSGDAVLGSGSGWDSAQTENGEIIKVGSTYYLYYSVVDTGATYTGGRAVGFATSTDLLHWTKDSSNPTFDGGRFCPGIMKYGGYYYMFMPHYVGWDGVTHANIELYRDTAPTFYRNSRVFLGIAIDRGSWDSYGLDTPFALTDDVTRSTFSASSNQLWVYYSDVAGGEGMTIDTSITAALTGGSSYAKFWVQVSADLSSSAQTIYVYYGKSDATSTSSGSNTFPAAFNDFTSAPSNLGEGAFQITSGTYLDTNGVGTGSGHYHGPRGSYDISNQTNFRFRYSAVQTANYAGEEREVVWLTDTAGKIIYYFYTMDYSTASATTYLQAYRQSSGAGTDFESDSPTGTTMFMNLDGYPTWSDGEYGIEFIRVGSVVGLNYTTGLAYTQLYSGYNGDQTTTTQIGKIMVAIQCGPDGSPPEIITHQINWYFISEYVNPEPTHGAWGTEEPAPITQYAVTFGFMDHSGSTILSAPSTFTVQAANGSSYTNPAANALFATGTVTLTAITWQGTDVLPASNPTVTVSGAGTLYFNVEVYSVTPVWNDSSGAVLYVQPSSFKWTPPNSSLSGTLAAGQSYLLQKGTTTISAVMWEGTDVTSASATFDASSGSPTFNLEIYGLTLSFKGDSGSTLYASITSYSIQFSNSTTANGRTASSYVQVQTGTITLTNILWEGTDVTANSNTYSLTSTSTWTMNLKIYGPTLSFKDGSGADLYTPVTSYSIQFPNSTTFNARTASSYSQVQTGTITLTNVSWEGTDVTAASNTYSLTSSSTWTMNLKVYALRIQALSAASNSTGTTQPIAQAVQVTFPNSTALAETPASGWINIPQLQVGSSILQTSLTIGGNSYKLNSTATIVLTSGTTVVKYWVFIGSSTISLGLSSTSVLLGGSVTLSGGIAPVQPPGTTVTLSYSIDGGATWNIFITTQIGGSGSYSATWYPPYLGTYQLRASWSGNSNCAGSTSAIALLGITGTRPPQIMLLVSGPSSVARGGSVTFDVLVTNPGASPTVIVYLDVIGPGGYEYFDTLQISVSTGASARLQFTWQVPATLTTGNYQVSVGLIPPTPTGISATQITVT